MIQPLRIAHRRVFFGLAVLLPCVLIAGIAARVPVMRVSSQLEVTPENAYLLRQSDRLWKKHLIQSKFFSNPARANEILVILQPEKPISDPDLLLYWVESNVSETSLPSSAVLLGSFVPDRGLSLPRGVHNGNLVLYSLAHREVIDTAAVEQLP